MNHHFAASWLKSLSGKLDSLTEWSWHSDKSGQCAMHRNLFKEFFSPPFQKTLALVDEQKKSAFLEVVERNLFKFDGGTQQFPLDCLCALLQHGKDSPRTQQKVGAWVGFVLERLRGGLGRDAVTEVMEECAGAPFQRFVPLMEAPLRERLADGLGEHLAKLDEESQRKALEGLAVLPERIDQVVAGCTKELNAWLEMAPKFPKTPMALADVLLRTEHPLVRFYARGIKDAARKEAFLVAVALALCGLRTRFRWMCVAEPVLEDLAAQLQRRLFTVEGHQGSVMETWLGQRLRKYNAEVDGRVAALLAADASRAELLRSRLLLAFPKQDATSEERWVALDGPTAIADVLLTWIGENLPTFFCPRHTIAPETLANVLRRFGPRHFEVDGPGARARPAPGAAEAPQAQLALGAPGSTPGMGQVVMPRPQFTPQFPPLPPPSGTTSSALVPVSGAAPTPVVVLPPSTPIGGGAIAGGRLLSIAPPPTSADGVDNLVDLLFREALEGVPAEARAQITKFGHGVYRIPIAGQLREVTFHTQNGQLFVYRVGDMVKHMSVRPFLQEVGLLPAPVAPGTGAAVDSGAVAAIALQSARISAGVTNTTAAPATQQTLPFGLSRDPQKEASKRVEAHVKAATQAMEISKKYVRQLINFDDERSLRKLLTKGLKHDKQWQSAYEEFCGARGITDLDPKMRDKQFIATFVERNLSNSINKEWAQRVLNPDDGGKKEKKDKKDKKDKKEKKRRKGSESSSSDERAVGDSTALAITVIDDPPSAPPGHGMLPLENMQMMGMGMPDGFGPMGGMGGPMGGPMGGHFGMPGMPPMGMGMPPMGMGMGMGMPPMAGMMDGHRPKKRDKPDKADKADKAAKKAEKAAKKAKHF